MTFKHMHKDSEYFTGIFKSITAFAQEYPGFSFCYHGRLKNKPHIYTYQLYKDGEPYYDDDYFYGYNVRDNRFVKITTSHEVEYQNISPTLLDYFEIILLI